VQSNVPVMSNCTASQMPDFTNIHVGGGVRPLTADVDPAATFMANNLENAGYASPNVPHRNKLTVTLPGSGGSCGGSWSSAEKLGFDTICVNYSNAASQDNICGSDLLCYGNVSQAKFDATGPCTVARQPPGTNHCGRDPNTGFAYFNNNPADAVVQRITKMLQYLNNSTYNIHGTDWGQYLTAMGTPNWSKILIGGHSQGGDMGTFVAHKYSVARVFNFSAPPQAAIVNNVMTAATYFSQMPMATDIRSVYGFVSFNDLLYKQGRFQAVWQAMGMTAANNDAEVKLNVAGNLIGINCNSGIPSHNFSTYAPVSPSGGHGDPLQPWNEDVVKFMLID
jgi:hypothetical protein